MSAIELLPCPFCGGEATTEHDATVEENHAYGCRRCGLWFDTFNSDDAITAWNRRTDLEAAYLTLAAESATLRASEAAALERVKVLTEALQSCPPTSNPNISAQEHIEKINTWWRLIARRALTPTADKEPTT